MRCHPFATRLVLVLLVTGLVGAGPAAAQTLEFLGQFPGNAIRGEDGLVYVPDAASDELRRIHPDGSEEVVLPPEGDGAGNPFALEGPYPNLVVDPHGAVLITEGGQGWGSDDVFLVKADGTVLLVSDGSPIGGAWPSWPRSLRLGRDGNFYFRAGISLFQVAPDGAVSVALTTSEDFTDYAVARSGSIFRIPLLPSGFNADHVLEVKPGGTEHTHVVGDEVGGAIDPLTPWDLELDNVGNLYVATQPGEPGVGVFRVGRLGGVLRLLDASGDGQGNEALEPAIAGIDARRNVYVQANRSGPLVYNALQITRGGDVGLVAQDGTGTAGIAALRDGRVFYIVYLAETGYTLADHFAYQPGPECSDGLDNDGDGLVDYPADDTHCSAPEGPWEGPSTIPVCGGGLSTALLLPAAVVWRARRSGAKRAA